MSVTLNFAWWAIPAIITTLALAWALFWPADDGGYLGGIGALLNMVIALFFALLAWAIAGALK